MCSVKCLFTAVVTAQFHDASDRISWPLKRRQAYLEGGKYMSEIYVKENESLDNALKRFKRSCAKSGVLADLRKKEYYQSPSVKRRKKSEAARKNKNKRYY